MSNVLPDHWYNIRPELPEALRPPRRPGGAGPAAISPSLRAQLSTPDTRVPIPEPVLDAYRAWRPTPLRRARALEAALGTPARIYYKYEGSAPTGTFKVNTALAQAYFLRQDGCEALVTQSNDGYWGAALAYACQRFGLDLTVFMMRRAFGVKVTRETLMRAYGARLVASPSPHTPPGRRLLQQNPQHPGTVGVAISEAMFEAHRSGGRVRYAHGFLLDHVLLHNTVIGLEAQAQLELEGATPDVVLACASSGANFGGLCFPFLRGRLSGASDTRFVAVESAACPTLTRGRYVEEHSDRAGMSPRLKMYSLGRHYERPAGHLGSLIFHGMSPLVSALYSAGHVEAKAVYQTDAFEAGLQFARCEGVLPAPECAHAVHAAIGEAARCREEGREEVILLGISGHSLLDTSGYQAYLAGELEDPVPSDAQLEAWLPGGQPHPTPPRPGRPPGR